MGISTHQSRKPGIQSAQWNEPAIQNAHIALLLLCGNVRDGWLTKNDSQSVPMDSLYDKGLSELMGS
ncbi:MAG: hypothetical protein U0930_18045 [Pirellulales bacterium]